MGTLPQLIAAMEQADGRAESSLSSFAYACRSGGLLSPSPGGRAANNITLEDCANMAIASALPLPVRLMPDAVRAFRNLPRVDAKQAFRIGKRKRYLTMATFAGDFLELLIENAPTLPEETRVELRFSPVGLALIAGVGRTVVVEYWARVKIGIDPPGGDRLIETSATFGIRTLRLLHAALHGRSPAVGRRSAGLRAAKLLSVNRGGSSLRQEQQPANFQPRS